MIYFMKFWAGLVGFTFIVACSALTFALAFCISVALFACALAVTLVIFFMPNAPEALQAATDIVLAPFYTGVSLVAGMWSQWWKVVSGKGPSSEPDGMVSKISTIAMTATLSVLVIAGITLSGLPGNTAVLAYDGAAFALLATWAIVISRLAPHRNSVIISAIGVLLGLTAAAIVGLIAAPWSGGYKGLAVIFGVIFILLIWAATLGVILEDDKESIE